MAETPADPPDLTGTVDERRRQLDALAAAGPLSAEWLRRQLEAALDAWASEESELDVDKERKVDF
ncbi:hypothetical protein [Microbacterium sp.]|jgi:hypothetical protein|uniref:hypothetical protein n=1 Tax=Microbacterium sp. TaxID=51671 RepID=UPI002C72E14C|nr:hypothetical protein [Microbacterium sp.]HET6301904.1 hypothetical protein [Microbacterium sp.]HWL77159.1 hypothetical protein [Microbacterium sp.]